MQWRSCHGEARRVDFSSFPVYDSAVISVVRSSNKGMNTTTIPLPRPIESGEGDDITAVVRYTLLICAPTRASPAQLNVGDGGCAPANVRQRGRKRLIMPAPFTLTARAPPSK